MLREFIQGKQHSAPEASNGLVLVCGKVIPFVVGKHLVLCQL